MTGVITFTNDLDGTDLIIDTDGATVLDETSDDNIRLTSGAASGRWNVLTLEVLETLETSDGVIENVGDTGTDFTDTGGLTPAGPLTSVANVTNVLQDSWITASFTYTAAAGDTFTLATIRDGEVWNFHGVWLHVTTNFDATGDDASMTIGDGSDPDGFRTLADAELQTSDTEGTGFAAGWQCQVAATRGAYQDGTGGFWYVPSGTDETIDAVLDETSGETLAGGAATTYVHFTRVE